MSEVADEFVLPEAFRRDTLEETVAALVKSNKDGQRKITEQGKELRELREALAFAEVELAHLRAAFERQEQTAAPVEPWQIKEQAARLVASLYPTS